MGVHQHVKDAAGGPRVEDFRGILGQNQARGRHQRAGDHDPPLVLGGQPVGLADQPCGTGELEQLRGALAGRLVNPAGQQRGQHVVAYRQRPQQGEPRRDKPALGAVAIEFLAAKPIDGDPVHPRLAGERPAQPGDHVEQADHRPAGLAKQRYALAGRHAEADAPWVSKAACILRTALPDDTGQLDGRARQLSGGAGRRALPTDRRLASSHESIVPHWGATLVLTYLGYQIINSGAESSPGEHTG